MTVERWAEVAAWASSDIWPFRSLSFSSVGGFDFIFILFLITSGVETEQPITSSFKKKKKIESIFLIRKHDFPSYSLN